MTIYSTARLIARVASRASRPSVYSVEVSHKGLGKFRRIKGGSHEIVNAMAEAQLRTWDEQWGRKNEQRERRIDKEIREGEKIAECNRNSDLKAAKTKDREAELERRREMETEAQERDQEARDLIESLKGILSEGALAHSKIDWKALLRANNYGEALPVHPSLSIQPVPMFLPRKPTMDDPEFVGNKNLVSKLLSFIDNKEDKLISAAFEESKSRWERACKHVNETNKIGKEMWQEATRSTKEKHAESVRVWSERKDTYENTQKSHKKLILDRIKNYLTGDEMAVVEYCEMVLGNSFLPAELPFQWDLDYSAEKKTLLVEYLLPSLSEMPSVKEVKFLPSKNEIREAFLSMKEKGLLYDQITYGLLLRVLSDLFLSDTAFKIESICINGTAMVMDASTGKERLSCLASALVTRQKFMEVNLLNINPKECFRKHLRGVSAGSLVGGIPIAPIMSMPQEDARFVEGYGVMDGIRGENIAEMDWLDFENLIRELLEREYAKRGATVKITRASRDGGIDAIIFDPDPLLGGKIAVQAKRYTLTVPPSAARDLYGTVISEGANKGILISTADFGPDSYAFTEGKPLTLVNGGQLLGLLKSQGIDGRIDLKEAKRNRSKEEKD